MKLLKRAGPKIIRNFTRLLNIEQAKDKGFTHV